MENILLAGGDNTYGVPHMHKDKAAQAGTPIARKLVCSPVVYYARQAVLVALEAEIAAGEYELRSIQYIQNINWYDIVSFRLRGFLPENVHTKTRGVFLGGQGKGRKSRSPGRPPRWRERAITDIS